MKIIPALFLGLMLIIAQGVAQTQKLDAIYLKNGSIIHGKIVTMEKNQDIKIETVGVNIFVIPAGEILKTIYNEKATVTTYARTGIEVISNLEYMGGNPKSSGGMTVIMGYRFHSGISTGLGFGFQASDISLMPIFADARYYLPARGKFDPFVSCQGGYAAAMSSGKKNSNTYEKVSYRGGFLGGGNIGICCKLNSNNCLLFSMGYRFQRSKKTTIYPDYYGQGRGVKDELINRMNRLLFTVGFLFR